MRFRRVITHLLIYILMSQITFSPFAQALYSPPKSPQTLDFSEFSNLPEINVHFENSDPVLDRDPFFLRSQGWRKLEKKPVKENPNAPFYARETGHGIEITADGFENALTLNQPLVPFFVHRDWIFLSANSPRFFKEKSPRDPLSGIFIVSTQELKKASRGKEKVPVYFLPLPDGNWTGNLRAIESPSHGAIVLFENDSTFALPVFEEDVEQVIKAERMNLTLSLASGVYARQKNNPSHNPFDEIHLPSGSTAGFGMLFTGQNLEQPEHSLIKNESQDFALSKKNNNFWSTFSLIAKAHADDALTPEQIAQIERDNALMRERIVRVGSILGIAFIGSVLLRYTIFKERFDKEIEFEKKKGAPLGKIAWTHTRQIFDVYAHTLKTLAQVTPVVLGNGLEFLIDRYAPKQTSHPHSLVRRFLNNTVFFIRNAVSDAPVNARTWMLGSNIRGGIDTVLSAASLFYFIPFMGGVIGNNIPVLKSRTDAAFAAGNAQTTNVVRNEVIHTPISYAQFGALADVVSRIRQERPPIEAQVRQEMKQQGKDTYDPSNQREFEEEVQKRLDIVLKKVGAPSRDEKVYDLITIWNKANEFLGYRRSSDDLEKSAERHWGELRPGLVLSALELATKEMQDRLKHSPRNTEYRNTFELYESLTRNAKTKMDLLLLTYDGRLHIEASRLPKSWIEKYGLEVSLTAGAFYRRAIFRLLHGDERILKGVSEKDTEKFLENAKLQVEKELPTATAFEKELAQEARVIELTKQFEEFNKSYSPKARSFFANRQLNKIIQVADSSPTLEWETAFVRAYLHEVGITPPFEDSAHFDFFNSVEKRASELTESFLSEPKVKKFLSSLSEKNIAIEKALIKSENWVNAYSDFTVRSSMSGLSPLQPGKFQRIRSSPFLKSDGFLSALSLKAIRIIEAAFPDSEFELGLLPWVYHSVPFSYDTVSGVIQTLRRSVNTLTAGYLFNKYFWGADISFTMAAFSLAFNFTAIGPHQYVNRVSMYLGWKTLDSAADMTMQSVLYSLVSFWGNIPMLIFANDFKTAWDKAFLIVGQIIAAPFKAAASACSSALR